MNLKLRRHIQAIKYGWVDAKAIAVQNNVNRFTVYRDILKFYRKYNIWSYHYKKDQLWGRPEEEKIDIAQKVGKFFKQRDLFVQYKYDERKFLNKYASLKYECIFVC